MNPDDVVKTKVDRQGRVLIPAAIREAMKMKPVSHVAIYDDEDGLHLVTGHIAGERLRCEIAKHVPEDVSRAVSVCPCSLPTAPGRSWSSTSQSR